MAPKEISTLCRVCLRSCGIRVSRTPKGIKIRGNPDHPISKGFLCFRGARYHKIWGSAQRISRPMIKKNGQWQVISFEDAVSILADKIRAGRQAHGAQSIAFLKGESLKHQEVNAYLRHFTHALGSPNYLTIGSMCQKALGMGHDITYGGIPQIEYNRVKAALVWGRNLAVASAPAFRQMKKAVKRGMKLIVIDPTRTLTAEAAHLHLRVTPGSDGYLALAFIKTAMETYGLEPDPDHEVGWEDLKTHLQETPLAVLLEKTGITRTDFSKAIELIFENRPCFNQAGLGLELQPNGIQTIRAIACFQSLVDPGQFPVGISFPMNPLPNQENYPEMPAPIGVKEAPYFVVHGKEGQAMLLPKAVLRDDPYPVRTLVVMGANPAITFPGASVQKETYAKLDFMAVSDLFMTETARQADLFLPAADFLDTLEIHDYGRVGQPFLGLVRPIPNNGPGWPVWKWVFRLARELGLESFFPWQDNEAALRYKLSGSGVGLDQLLTSPGGLVPYPLPLLSKKAPDNSKKVNYFSQAVEEAAGAGSITTASFRLPFETDAAYPFWLSTGDRVAVYQHSQFRVSNTYLQKAPRPLVDIHPETARKKGIAQGEMVTLTTRYGKLTVEANLTRAVRRDCLRMLHGWNEANVNELTGLAHLDPVSGFPWCRALPSNLQK